MTTQGQRGNGPRHRLYTFENKTERASRELAQAKRTIDKLEHRLGAIEQTLRVVGKLAQPYVGNSKPSAPLRRIIEIKGHK